MLFDSKFEVLNPFRELKYDSCNLRLLYTFLSSHK